MSDFSRDGWSKSFSCVMSHWNRATIHRIFHRQAPSTVPATMTVVISSAVQSVLGSLSHDGSDRRISHRRRKGLRAVEELFQARVTNAVKVAPDGEIPAFVTPNEVARLVAVPRDDRQKLRLERPGPRPSLRVFSRSAGQPCQALRLPPSRAGSRISPPCAMLESAVLADVVTVAGDGISEGSWTRWACIVAVARPAPARRRQCSPATEATPPACGPTFFTPWRPHHRHNVR